jgi:hypothetical protein
LAAAACSETTIPELAISVFGEHATHRDFAARSATEGELPWLLFASRHQLASSFGAPRAYDLGHRSSPPFDWLKRFSKSYSAIERAALFHDTAVKAYRIA